jgi:ribosomal protein S18 acetylase RimI-like enzyme
VTKAGGVVRVRVACADDEVGLTRLDAAAWTAESGFPSVMERASDSFFSYDSPAGSHLVAEVEGRLVGYLRLKPATALPENAHVFGVFGLAVVPDGRRRGVATALLAAAEEHARARGARKLSLRVLSTNKGAQRLYERLGFQREGVLRSEFIINGRAVDDVLMAKLFAPGDPQSGRDHSGLPA